MEVFLQEWNGKFGAEVKPPEWVFELSANDDKQQENVVRKIVESVNRVEKLREELDRELFLLGWLRKLREDRGLTVRGGSLQGPSVSVSQNHVEAKDELPDTEEVFEELPNVDSNTELGKAEQLIKLPAVSSKGSLLSTTESSPSSSDYHTAGQSSPGNLTEDSSPLIESTRHRLVHKVGVSENLLAQEALCRVERRVRKFKSCDNLSKIDSDAGLDTLAEKHKRRRRNSAPNLITRPQTTGHKKLKRRLLSSPCVNSAVGRSLDGVDSPLAHRARQHTKRRNTSSSLEGVIFREKRIRRPSFQMNDKEAIDQWKGGGGASSLDMKRSSNGTFEGYSFMVNNDEDSDPALINVMASRMRGGIRTPRTSTSEGNQVANGEGGGVVSPSEDTPHTPMQSFETIFRDSSGKHIAPLRKRSSMHEASPKKGERDRFSYHYSDDECLTPKIDSGGHGLFSGSSPSGSNNCSHRNSRSSNGIIDEEGPYDMTLRRQDARETRAGRTDTITQENVRHSSGYLDEKESSLTSTLTSQHIPHVGTSSEGGGGGGSEPGGGDLSIFEKSDSYTDHELGSLERDIENMLDKLQDKPEMSMATLLDMNENQRMNARASQTYHKDSSPENLEESIEIDEATISAFTLSNDLYSSRSNSASSIPGLFSDSSALSMSPPEPESPTHVSALQGVNLRSGGGKRSKYKKRMGNLDLELMTGGAGAGGSDNEEVSLSRSSTSLTSEEESIPTSPLVDENLSPGSRASRLYPVRHSTVVIHGEQLVIRKLVVVGVVSAEKSYIECLSVLKEYYRKPLLALTTVSQPLISERDINTIFYRVEDLHQVHSQLHEGLEMVLSSWSVGSCVGHFFIKLCHSLTLYKDYVEKYQKAVECLNRNKLDNPLFKKFLEDVHLTVANTNKAVPKVNELLRRPVERLQSYSLVLTDLCQHTPVDHADHRVLKESLQAMSAFIASTHDPQAFRELSGGYNREMVKEGLMVELSEGLRKIRRVFLFHDVLVSTKQKPARQSMKFEPKWYLPLCELSFKCPDDVARKPVPVSSEIEMSVMKNKIAELKAQVNQQSSRDRERSSSTSGEGFNIRSNIFMIKYGGSKKQSEKAKKKLQEQQVSFWVASPSLPLRIFGKNGKQYMFLLHNEEERENWISAISKLIPKANHSVSLTSFELQDLLSRQTINDLRKVEEMIVPTAADEDYLSGVLRVVVMSATDLKAKPVGLYCCLELDEYGKFERKARTLPTNTDNATLTTTWDQDFEVELTGAHTMKVQVCSKSLLKEETYAHGKIRLPIKDLKQSKRQKLKVPLVPQGFITLVIEYFANMASLSRKPTLLSSGVFGVPIEVVAKRERHDIPLIVQTCVDEVEKRGLTEVGVYRVAGVMRDVQELRQSFDTDYLKAQVIAFETDIHAVAGLLKRYFRELPDPLFTEELYVNFVQALGLSDPEARDQCLLSLLYSLPLVNFKTAVFLFKHLRRVAANSSHNKMTLTNLATIFGPNLLQPGGDGSQINMDVVTPVSVVLYFLNCPEEYFDEGSNRTSPDSTGASGGSGSGSGGRRGGVNMDELRASPSGGGGGEGGAAFMSRVSSGSQLSRDQLNPEDPAWSSGKVNRRSRRASGRKPSSGSVRGSTSSVKNVASASSLTPSRESVI